MDRKRAEFAWRYYFWLLVLFAAISPFLGPFDPAGWAFWVYDIIGLIGLWAYLRRRPIVSRHLWAAYVLAAAAATVYYSVAFLAEETEFRGFLIGVGLVALALSLPLYLALWRYAFRSPDVWGDGGV